MQMTTINGKLDHCAKDQQVSTFEGFLYMSTCLHTTFVNTNKYKTSSFKLHLRKETETSLFSLSGTQEVKPEHYPHQLRGRTQLWQRQSLTFSNMFMVSDCLSNSPFTEVNKPPQVMVPPVVPLHLFVFLVVRAQSFC